MQSFGPIGAPKEKHLSKKAHTLNLVTTCCHCLDISLQHPYDNLEQREKKDSPQVQQQLTELLIKERLNKERRKTFKSSLFLFCLASFMPITIIS